MRFLSIKNLNAHQHYKNRRPPWIKLHAALFDDYAFQCLQDASKAHLMLLWLLASQMDNRIPYDLPFINRKLGASNPVDIEELILQGFLEVSQDDGKPLAARKQKPIVERETEAERETDSSPPAAPKVAGAVSESWPKSWAHDTSQRFLKHSVVIPPATCGSHAKSLRDTVPWPEWLRIVDRMAQSDEVGYGLPALLRRLPAFRDGTQLDPNRPLTLEEAMA